MTLALEGSISFNEIVHALTICINDKVWEGVVRRLEKRLEKVAEFDFIPVTSLKSGEE